MAISILIVDAYDKNNIEKIISYDVVVLCGQHNAKIIKDRMGLGFNCNITTIDLLEQLNKLYEGNNISYDFDFVAR